MIDELRTTFLFEACSDDQLQWIVEHSEVVAAPAGTTLFAENDVANDLWVLLHGEVRITRMIAGREVILETSTTPGSWAGWLPMFDDVPMTLTSQVLRPSRVLRLPRDSVRSMLANGFPVTNHLLNGLYLGVQNFEALSRQQEKLAALGKMSAGLAHELNNPASAARRAADALRKAIAAAQTDALAHDDRFTPQQRDRLTVLSQTVAVGSDAARLLDPVARSDREDHLATWLDDQGVDRGWEIAPTLVGAGIEREQIAALAADFPDGELDQALGWLETSITLHALTDDVQRSTGRISELVRAMKSYTYMDQADRQEVDVHGGIEDTLTVLHHKWKQGVSVTRNYDRSLPRLCVYAGELNQVWTNLIDNAIDAMDGSGTITITTSTDGEFARIEIADTGPGIPRDMLNRIWEPFFTTKGVGDGTGLGLDIVRRIVEQHHHGEIRVRSQPGDTRFEVCLPLDQTTDDGPRTTG